jgi:glutamate/tyrosine decarboxylase-like PLP-dependent enzyme
MIEKIKKLEKSALRLEPGPVERKIFLEKVNGYAEDFLNNVGKLPSYVFTEDKGIGIYDSPVSEKGIKVEKLLEILKNNVDTPGLNTASRGHLGYIPGGGIYYSALGDFLAAVTNRYAGVFFASPGAVRMENMMTNWMAEIIGYPAEAGGNLTSGGSVANLVGIVTARDSAVLKARDFEKSVIYMTNHAHHSIDKAIRIAGLKECVQRFIPVDERWRMKTDLLEDAINEDKKNGLNPFIVIASAGTTDTGAVDPLDEIGEIASSHKIWYHLDAAYGGFFVLAESAKSILKGIEKPDSIIMDPHKGLFLPYGSGAVLVKDKMKLLESNHYMANYMQDAADSKEELAPGDLSPELSKHFRGLRLWLPLKLLGVAPFRDSLEEKILLARYFYEKLGEIKGFELGPFPDLSVVTFRYIPEKGDANEFNRMLVNEIQQDGRLFLSSTMLDNKFIIRLAVLAFRTHLDTIDEMIEIIKEKVEKLIA